MKRGKEMLHGEGDKESERWIERLIDRERKNEREKYKEIERNKHKYTKLEATGDRQSDR